MIVEKIKETKAARMTGLQKVFNSRLSEVAVLCDLTVQSCHLGTNAVQDIQRTTG